MKRLVLSLFLLGTFCARAPDYFPLVRGLALESKNTKTTIIDGDTTQSEKSVTVAVADRIVYGTLGHVTQVNEIVADDTIPRYYRKSDGEVWLFWEKPDDKKDSALILPARPGKGTRWVFSRIQSGPIYCTVKGRDHVSVPAGSFLGALKVQFEFPGQDSIVETRWYAPGVGVIKDDFTRVQSKGGHTLREVSVTELATVRR